MKRTAIRGQRSAVSKRPRFEVIKLKVWRGTNGSSYAVCAELNRKLKKHQRLVYLKHNTLINNRAYWTAIIENT
jgi:hypothetical protein